LDSINFNSLIDNNKKKFIYALIFRKRSILPLREQAKILAYLNYFEVLREFKPYLLDLRKFFEEKGFRIKIKEVLRPEGVYHWKITNFIAFKGFATGRIIAEFSEFSEILKVYGNLRMRYEGMNRKGVLVVKDNKGALKYIRALLGELKKQDKEAEREVIEIEKRYRESIGKEIENLLKPTFPKGKRYRYVRFPNVVYAVDLKKFLKSKLNITREDISLFVLVYILLVKRRPWITEEELIRLCESLAKFKRIDIRKARIRNILEEVSEKKFENLVRETEKKKLNDLEKTKYEIIISFPLPLRGRLHVILDELNGVCIRFSAHYDLHYVPRSLIKLEKIYGEIYKKELEKRIELEEEIVGKLLRKYYLL